MTVKLLRQKIPVIIDTDPGVDDAIAILLALASPEIDILAYIVSFGNTDIQASYANILKIYQAVTKHIEEYPEARTNYPNLQQVVKPLLAKGAHGPLEGELHSAKYFHGRDGLGEVDMRSPDLNIPTSALESSSHPQLHPTERPGHEVALDILRSYGPREVTYIVLGPMTNLAQMMRTDATLVRERIGRVIIMGGALDVPGNTSPVAEFNFFADPFAAAEVLVPSPTGKPPLHPGLPPSRVLLLPLDITTIHELPFSLYTERVDPMFSSTVPSVKNGKPPLSHFTSSFLQHTREIMRSFGKDMMELHDIVAVWCALENPPVKDGLEGNLELSEGWEAIHRTFEIECIGQITRGMCVVDRRDDVGAYAPGKNRASVQAALERRQIKHGPFESVALPAQVEVENKSQAEIKSNPGVPCIVKTPGSEVLVQLMLQRIWGV